MDKDAVGTIIVKSSFLTWDLFKFALIVAPLERDDLPLASHVLVAHSLGLFNALKGGDPMSSTFTNSVGSLFEGKAVEQSSR